MCGIFGFIGKSTNPKVTFDFANVLFQKTESRGIHASGFWGCAPGDDKVFYDKEAIRSTTYVHRDIWCKQFAAANADLLLGHCRYSSNNVGSENVNNNNHPHVNSDKTVALIHNGRVPEYKDLKDRYEMNSDCDSEILLRIFESTENDIEKAKSKLPDIESSIAHRVQGIREIYARVNYGAMAVAIGERCENGGRRLWLFRDNERPLHIVDLRNKLGQVFFFSTVDIWRDAMDALPAIREFHDEKQRIVELPPLQICCVQMDADGVWPEKNVRKFSVVRSKTEGTVPPDATSRFARRPAKTAVTVVTRLDDKENVIFNSTLPANSTKTEKIHKSHHVPAPSTSTSTTLETATIGADLPDDVEMESMDKKASECIGLIEQICTLAKNARVGNKLSLRELELTSQSLINVKHELDVTINFLEGE